MIEREKAAVKFFMAHQQFAKAVKPAVRNFNDPAPGLFGGLAFEFIRFLPAPFDMSHVAMRLHEAQYLGAGVAGISTQVFAAPLGGCLLTWMLSKYGGQLRDTMAIGPGDDE